MCCTQEAKPQDRKYLNVAKEHHASFIISKEEEINFFLRIMGEDVNIFEQHPQGWLDFGHVKMRTSLTSEETAWAKEKKQDVPIKHGQNISENVV